MKHWCVWVLVFVLVFGMCSPVSAAVTIVKGRQIQVQWFDVEVPVAGGRRKLRLHVDSDLYKYWGSEFTWRIIERTLSTIFKFQGALFFKKDIIIDWEPSAHKAFVSSDLRLEEHGTAGLDPSGMAVVFVSGKKNPHLVFAHEMAHANLFGLRVPRVFNEGIALAVEFLVGELITRGSDIPLDTLTADFVRGRLYGEEGSRFLHVSIREPVLGFSNGEFATKHPFVYGFQYPLVGRSIIELFHYTRRGDESIISDYVRELARTKGLTHDQSRTFFLRRLYGLNKERFGSATMFAPQPQEGIVVATGGCRFWKYRGGLLFHAGDHCIGVSYRGPRDSTKALRIQLDSKERIVLKGHTTLCSQDIPRKAKSIMVCTIDKQKCRRIPATLMP